MLSRLTDYKTRREREEERELRKRLNFTYIEPRSELEKAIADTSQIIHDAIKNNKKIPNGEALDIYMSARSYRHDVWLDYLNIAKAEQDMKFTDTRVKEFHEKLLKDTNAPLSELPSNIANLSPDILYYSNRYRCIIIGDVTCTSSMRDADKRKHIKYRPIVEFYESNRFVVKHMNFIVEANLNNINHMIQTFVENGIIINIHGSKNRYMHYHKVADKIMTDILEIVENKKNLLLSISIADKMQTDDYDQIQLPPDVKFPELSPSEPKLTEEELAMQVKAEVEKMPKDYFDNNIDKINLALNELKEKHKDKEHMQPKSTLKVVSNNTDIEKNTNYNLVRDYLQNALLSDSEDTKEYIQWLLPNSKQLDMMEEVRKEQELGVKNNNVGKDIGVYGPYQYRIPRNQTDNMIINKTQHSLLLGKKVKNDKKEPKSIDPQRYMELYGKTDDMIHHFGSESNKPEFLDDSWDSQTNLESESSKYIRDIYRKVKRTNGVQLAHSLSNLYQRLTHVSTSLSKRDNIYIPPNGSFLCIIPSNHAPITSANCDVPLIFITRVRNNSPKYHEILNSNEYEYIHKGDEYTFIISKLCRLNIDKMANWDQAGYKLCGTASYLASLDQSVPIERIVGILTLMILDIHQKTSELLDLLKYIAFMPFADLSRLSALISDKMDIMIKTNLDVWTLIMIENLIKELMVESKLNASKPKIQLHNGMITHESLGMNLNLPSLFDINVRHTNVTDYIEEVAMLFIVRGKHLYGSQFMDGSITKTAEWELEFREEINRLKGWVLTGEGDGPYPFDSQFAFNADAIKHAQRYYDELHCIDKSKAMKDLTKGTYGEFMHYNCSLRGCTKEPEDRKNPSDLHTTSMEACLNHYEKKKYEDVECTSNAVAYDFMRNCKTMEFSMSEKDQRGGGRPIATPTLGTKASLMLLEKPEASIGKQCPNNIIVPGKNKLQELCECYKKLLTKATIANFKYIFQITEDQSKFSEMDNPRKFNIYIDNNDNLDNNIKKVQKRVVEDLLNREHLVKRMPKSITETGLAVTLNSQKNGVKTQIGWPQGMCNFISTSIHMIADPWITKLYNIAYPDNQVMTSGLVHSDDSWVAVACNTKEDFELFCKFRIKAKKYFCLKMNEKKLWGSSKLGELVSNYNINGNVHLSISKSLANSFCNLNYQSWIIDCHSQISTLQQCYRQGASLPVLIMISTILRQQILGSYQIKGLQQELLYQLPPELGGYPGNSVFELAVNGINSFYYAILNDIKANPTSKVSKIVLRCLTMSIKKMKSISEEDFRREIQAKTRSRVNKELFDSESTESELERMDYSSIRLPYRGDVFTCVQHIMPSSNKIKKTVARIRSLPFNSDGLEMVVSRPDTLASSLGHLKEQTGTLLYSLAADKYTQNARRLACSQSLQSSGRTVKLEGFKPTTINGMLQILLDIDGLLPATTEQLGIAFTDSNPVPLITSAIVYQSQYGIGSNDKRKVINRVPEVDDNYRTLIPMKDILLYIIDSKMGTSYYAKYGNKSNPLSLVEREAETIKKRFNQYFYCYDVKVACNLIMRLTMENKKTRLWMQPKLNNESIISFLEDLYGKTLSPNFNYRIRCDTNLEVTKTKDIDIVNSVYTTCVLNNLYKDHFIIEEISNVNVTKLLEDIDVAKLPMDALLKFAVIIKYLYDDDTYLKMYDDSKMYSKYFIKAQELVQGRYQGYFVVIIKYGTVVMKVSGVPGNLSLEVNNININDILMCMMLFTNDCFPEYRYHHPNQWHNSQLWKSELNFGSLYLTSYTQTITIVNKTPIGSSLPLVKNEYLKYSSMNIDRDDSEYILEHNLRVIYKAKGENKIRIGTVKQNLSCPLAKHIKVRYLPLDGLNNIKLLQSKLIINITLKRHFANSKSEILEIIKDANVLDDRLVVSMYTYMLYQFRDHITPREFRTLGPLEVIGEYDISEGVDMSSMAILGGTTSPEDLTHVETNFLAGEIEQSSSLTKYSNILKYLCQCLFIHHSEKDLSDIMNILISDRSIQAKICDDIQDPDIMETLDSLMMDPTNLTDIEVLCFIVGYDFVTEHGWNRIDLKEYIKNVKRIEPTRESIRISRLLNDALREVVFDMGDDNLRDILLGTS